MDTSNFNFQNILDDILRDKCKQDRFCSSDIQRIRQFTLSKLNQSQHCQREKPVLLCLGGLPGVGKTTYYQRKKLSRSFFIVDPDEYRQLYNSTKPDPADFVRLTSFWADSVTEVLLESAFLNHFQILITSTFSSNQFWDQYFKANQELLKHYIKVLLILAEPQTVCIDSINHRYDQDTKQQFLTARAPDFLFFHECCKTLGNSLRYYINNKIFDKEILLARRHREESFSLVGVGEKIINAWESVTFSCDVS